jgi:hypothetical protein
LNNPLDDHVVIGELSSEPINGYKGTRLFYTALVPLSDLASVVLTPGGIGRGIAVSSPEQTSPGTSLPAPFWIYGPDSSTKFETMLNVWDNHKQSMLLPDNAFLMAYQLSPRFIEGGSIPQRDGLVARGAEEDVYRTCIN